MASQDSGMPGVRRDGRRAAAGAAGSGSERARIRRTRDARAGDKKSAWTRVEPPGADSAGVSTAAWLRGLVGVVEERIAHACVAARVGDAAA
jgi:hypothetical protein